MSAAPLPINLASPLHALHQATLPQGAHTAQFRYAYSNETLARLCEQDILPGRLKQAVLRRQVDFLAGRLCARHALRAAGFSGAVAIAIGERGQPLWPQGFVGSISHCDGLAIAAVGSSDRFAGIGLDVEQEMAESVSREIGDQVASAGERNLGPREGLPAAPWLSLLFSGKESLFKALYPSVGAYFDFLDAGVTGLDVRSGMFALRLHVALSPQHGAGSVYAIGFQRDAGHVLTWCVLPSSTSQDNP